MRSIDLKDIVNGIGLTKNKYKHFFQPTYTKTKISETQKPGIATRLSHKIKSKLTY